MNGNYKRHGRNRIWIQVFAMNADRVLYNYELKGEYRCGSVSRDFFDRHYSGPW